MTGQSEAPGTSSGCRRSRMLHAVVGAAVLAFPAAAQAWTYGSLDNGAWFEAHVTAPDRQLSLHCGGRSPGGRPLPQSDEPMVTPDYTFILTLGQAALGVPGNATRRGDLVIASGTRGYRLPGAVYDELNATGWVQVLRFGDPLVAELRQTPAIAVDVASGRLATYGTADLGPELDRAIAFCDARWAAVGVPLPSDAQGVVATVRARSLDVSPTVAAAAPATGLARQRADIAVRQGCGGGYEAGPEAFLAGDIDGDGAEDIAIKWDAITCRGSLPRPFCGASQCAVEVVLSSRELGEGQGTLYAQAAELTPLSNGNMGLKLGGSLGMCREFGRTACSFVWYWNGSSLEQLAVE